MRRLAALLVVTSIALGACGGDDDDDVATDETTTTTSTTEADVEETTTTTEVEETTTTTPAAASPMVTALEIYAAEILRWPDAELERTAIEHELVVTSATYGRARVSMIGNDTTGWQVDTLSTDVPSGDAASASVKLGYGSDDQVAMGYQDPDLTPDLTIAYGDGFANLFVRGGAPGGPAVWDDIELDPTLDNGPRRITVMWRDADGAATAAWVQVVPAGEFAAG